MRHKFGSLVKLVITPPCHGGGHGFESRRSRHSISIQVVRRILSAENLGASPKMDVFRLVQQVECPTYNRRMRVRIPRRTSEDHQSLKRWRFSDAAMPQSRRRRGRQEMRYLGQQLSWESTCLASRRQRVRVASGPPQFHQLNGRAASGSEADMGSTPLWNILKTGVIQSPQNIHIDIIIRHIMRWILLIYDCTRSYWPLGVPAEWEREWSGQ